MIHTVQCLRVLTAISLCWWPTRGQFIKQPGDEAVMAIPGKNILIPCILNETVNAHVEWEQNITADVKTISEEKNVYPSYQQFYEFPNSPPWDYSIIIKTALHVEPQVRCYLVITGRHPSSSSWSNITYGISPIDTNIADFATVASEFEYASVVSPGKTFTQSKVKVENDIDGSNKLATTSEVEEDFNTIGKGHQVTTDYMYPNRDTPGNEENNDKTVWIVSNVTIVALVLTFIIIFTIMWKCYTQRKLREAEARRTLPTLTQHEEASLAQQQLPADITFEPGEANHPEVIPMRTLSEGVPPNLASDESSEGSNTSGTIPAASSYNTPNPYYVNQHMVKPVYAFLYSEIGNERRRSSRDADYEEIETDEYEIPLTDEASLPPFWESVE